MRLKSLIKGMIFFALAIISLKIFGNLVWNTWQLFIKCLVELGLPPWIEYVLGLILLLICVQMGLVTLKGVKK